MARRVFRAEAIWVPLLAVLSRIALGVLFDHILLRTLPVGHWGNPHTAWYDGFFRWDSYWYYAIAAGGYRTLDQTAFFPAYPLLIRLVVRFGASYLGAGIGIAWISLIGAAQLAYRLFVLRVGRRGALLALLLLLWSPGSVFLLSAYSEAPLLLFSLLAFYIYERWPRQAWLAFLCAGIASATRLTGALVAVALAVDMLWRAPALRARPWRLVAPLLLGEFGFIAFLGLQTAIFGNPLSFMLAEHHWARVLTVPFRSTFVSLRDVIFRQGLLSGNAYAVYLLDDIPVLMALAGLLYAACTRRGRAALPIAWAVFAVLGLLESVTTAPYGYSPEALARFVMVLFPIYPLLVRLGRDKITASLLLPLSLVLSLVGQALFNLGYWFT